MSNPILTAASNAVALDDPTHEIAIGSPSLIRCMPSLAPHTSNGQLAVGTAKNSTERSWADREPRTDYATRLRAAFHVGSKQALISREDAMGAATQIELLWLAL
jgi:hypothetical protein